MLFLDYFSTALYLLFGILIVAGIVLFVYVAMRALIPKDVYIDKNSPGMAPLMRCRHCDEMITRKNQDQHGANCAKKK